MLSVGTGRFKKVRTLTTHTGTAHSGRKTSANSSALILKGKPMARMKVTMVFYEDWETEDIEEFIANPEGWRENAEMEASPEWAQKINESEIKLELERPVAKKDKSVCEVGFSCEQAKHTCALCGRRCCDLCFSKYNCVDHSDKEY